VANLDLRRLKAVQGEPPKTLIACIRLAWPDIKAALNGGHSLKAVHQRLPEAGIKISYRRLSEYVGRLRREEKRFGIPPKGPQKGLIGSDSSVGDAKPLRIKAPEEQRPVQPITADPLADYRERTAKTKTFEYEPGPPDESKLI
jgi:hypothetical protein